MLRKTTKHAGNTDAFLGTTDHSTTDDIETSGSTLTAALTELGRSASSLYVETETALSETSPLTRDLSQPNPSPNSSPLSPATEDSRFHSFSSFGALSRALSSQKLPGGSDPGTGDITLHVHLAIAEGIKAHLDPLHAKIANLEQKFAKSTPSMPELPDQQVQNQQVQSNVGLEILDLSKELAEVRSKENKQETIKQEFKQALSEGHADTEKKEAALTRQNSCLELSSTGYVPVGIIVDKEIKGVFFPKSKSSSFMKSYQTAVDLFTSSLEEKKHVVHQERASYSDMIAIRSLKSCAMTDSTSVNLTTDFDNVVEGIAEYEWVEETHAESRFPVLGKHNKGGVYVVKTWKALKVHAMGDVLYGASFDFSPPKPPVSIRFRAEVKEISEAIKTLQGEIDRNKKIISYTNNCLFRGVKQELEEINNLKRVKRKFLNSLMSALDHDLDQGLSKEDIFNSVVSKFSDEQINKVIQAKNTTGRTLSLMKKFGYEPPVEKVEKRFGGIFSCCISR